MSVESGLTINGRYGVQTLTMNEASQLLNVHSNTLRRWSNLGIIRAHRISPRGDRRFKRDDIIRFMYKLHAHNGNVKKVKIEWS
jgi:excisionase family DNA binding protein